MNYVLGYGVVYPVFGFAPRPPNQVEANKKSTELLEEFCANFLKKQRFVAGEDISIAEYRIAPLLFAASLPAVEEATGFKLSTRMATYLQDSLAAIDSSDFLSDAGGNSIKEYLQRRRVPPAQQH